MWIRIRKGATLALLGLIIGGLLYTVVRSVLLVKGGNDSDENLITEQSTGDVVGLPGVPVFPGAEFMFRKNTRDEIVQSFLGKGRSAYTLPTDTTWDEVTSYYVEQLQSRGWRHELTVELSDTERLPGEYWVFEITSGGDAAVSENSELTGPEINLSETTANNAENRIEPVIDTAGSYGLRIYSKTQSVWYERTSYEDARTGLSSEIAREKEIDLILATGSTEELPESFPWKLSYPELWDAEVRESLVIEAPMVEFSDGGSSGVIAIEPIAFDTGKPLEEVAGSFLQEVNSRRSEDTRFSLVTTRAVTIDEVSGIEYEIGLDEARGYFSLVVHPGNGIVYAVTCFDADEASYQYVKEHMEVW